MPAVGSKKGHQSQEQLSKNHIVINETSSNNRRPVWFGSVRGELKRSASFIDMKVHLRVAASNGCHGNERETAPDVRCLPACSWNDIEIESTLALTKVYEERGTCIKRRRRNQVHVLALATLTSSSRFVIPTYYLTKIIEYYLNWI